MLALPILALAGCTGDDPEPIMPTESSSTTPQASEPPPTPEPWEEKTDDGAVAFVEHWYELANSARLEGVTAPLAEASTAQCETCRNFVEIAAKFHQPGGIYDSKPWVILHIGKPTHLTPATWELVVRVRQPAARQKLPEAEEVTNFRGGQVTDAATVRWVAGHWKMHELAALQ